MGWSKEIQRSAKLSKGDHKYPSNFMPSNSCWCVFFFHTILAERAGHAWHRGREFENSLIYLHINSPCQGALLRLPKCWSRWINTCRQMPEHTIVGNELTSGLVVEQISWPHSGVSVPVKQSDKEQQAHVELKKKNRTCEAAEFYYIIKVGHSERSRHTSMWRTDSPPQHHLR